MFYTLGLYLHLELSEMLFREELMKHGSRLIELELFMVKCSELCGIKHAFMPITVNVVTEEEYNQWLEKAKVEFAKEEINNNIKVAKKLRR
jgi:hypothetical protein